MSEEIQKGPQEGAKEKEAPKKAPEEAAKDEKKKEVKEKFGDEKWLDDLEAVAKKESRKKFRS